MNSEGQWQTTFTNASVALAEIVNKASDTLPSLEGPFLKDWSNVLLVLQLAAQHLDALESAGMADGLSK
jgi:hypothetical protein